MSVKRQWRIPFQAWFDSESEQGKPGEELKKSPDLLRCIPFLLAHVACLGVFFVGWSWFAVGVAAFLYFIRMFAITGFYHRYFSHRGFKTNRFWQFVFALIGVSSGQRGPLWWAAHHRDHHRHSDTEQDIHSPSKQGFWWSHMFWFTSEFHFSTKFDKIKDFSKYPELRFLNRYDMAAPVLLAVSLFVIGYFAGQLWPALGTSGWQLLMWGFFISTLFLWHATFTINSLAHQFGSRRFKTKDDSRNNWFLAIITLGEGWHNNHHRFPGSTRQGFYWWEVDITYAMLKVMSWFGIVWDLRPVPAKVLAEGSRRNRNRTDELPRDAHLVDI
jgi:stearoyl-CoA desaturase (delta-9 desaturase)